MVRVLSSLLLLDHIDEVGALSNLVVLDRLGRLADCLNVNANGAHLGRSIDLDSVLVDTLDDDRLEVTVSVGAKHHLLVKL